MTAVPPGSRTRRWPVLEPAILLEGALAAIRSSDVEVSVKHLLRSGPGSSRPDHPTSTTTGQSDTFVSFTGPWGVRITARPTSGGAPRRPRVPGGRRLVVNSDHWRGSLPHEPYFAGRGRERMDIVVTVREGPWSLRAAADAELLQAAETVVALAHDFRLPVSAIRSPSAGFDAVQLNLATNPSDQNWDRPAHPVLARGLNLRFTIALDDAANTDRGGFLDRLVRAAEEEDHGWDVRVLDRRYEDDGGQWEQLTRLRNGGRPRSRLSALGNVVVPITVLGPSRAVSYRRVAQALLQEGLDVAAITCLELHEVDVWHSLVVTNPVAAVRVRQQMERVLARLQSPLDQSGRGPRGTVLVAVVHHRSGPALQPHVPRERDDREVRPIWAEYELSGDPEPPMAALLVDLLRRQPMVHSVRVEYERRRWIDSQRRIERLLLAVELDTPPPNVRTGNGESTDQHVINLCQRVTGAFGRDRHASFGTANGAFSIARLRMSARERSLGTWLDDH